MAYIDCLLRLGTTQASLQLGSQRYDGAPQLTPTLFQDLKQLADDAQQYGQKLFDALFPSGSPLDTGLRNALNLADGQKLRLRLDISETAMDLHELNWELLYNRKALAGGEFQAAAQSEHQLYCGPASEQNNSRRPDAVAGGPMDPRLRTTMQREQRRDW